MNLKSTTTNYDGPGGSQSSTDFWPSSYGFTQSSFNFYTVQFYFFLHSPVLNFTQSSFNFHTIQFYFFLHSPVLFLHGQYTVQFYFYTVNIQSSFIFCVVTRPLSLYCNTCYLTAAILYFLATMDSIIRQVVQEELRRSNSSRPETASSTNQDDQGRSENESGAAGSSRTVGRLGCF